MELRRRQKSPQDAAKHKEQNVQRQKRYQAKMREEVEKRREKIWKGSTKRKIETPPECTAQNISPPKGDAK